jgi:peptidyl-prolyl cis-trans isomerase D
MMAPRDYPKKGISMRGRFQKKTSQIVVGIIVFLVVISFILTGTQFGQGGANQAGKVGPHKISIKDLDFKIRQMEAQFTQMMGGKPLTAQQRKQFRLNQMAWNQLVSAKIQLIMANKMGLLPSRKEQSERIKAEFTRGQSNSFDYQTYKEVLRLNNMRIEDYERAVEDELKLKALFENTQQALTVSENFAKFYQDFAERSYLTNVLVYRKSQLRKFLPVSQEKIDQFLQDPSNDDKLQTLFNSKKSKLAQKEKVKARHILIKSDPKNDEAALKKIQNIAKSLTPQNFTVKANQYTQDPSGKGKGGDLGWFSRGKMVPEFEKVAFSQKPGSISKPVKTPFGYHLIYVEKKQAAREAKLSQHKRSLAKELIQDLAKERFDQFVSSLEKQWLKKLAQDKDKALTQIRENYGVQLRQKLKVSRLQSNVAGLELGAEQLKKIFESKEDTVRLDRDKQVLLLARLKEENSTKKLSEVVKQQAGKYSQEFMNTLFEDMRKNTEVVQYVKFES